MIEAWPVHGYAIVSSDDRIAGTDGRTPPSLRNQADWDRFQAALDAAAVTVLGRLGHEANPNVRRRNRLVLSSKTRGLRRQNGTWWWNPDDVSLGDALNAAAPDGGIALVPGGRRVFDYFLEVGYAAFHLSRAGGVRIPGGVPLFSRIDPGRNAATVLASRGLLPGATEILDAAADISLTVWCPAVQPRSASAFRAYDHA